MTLYPEIVGTGSAVPEKVLTNADLEKMVDTSDQWIVERTGIKERRIADEKTTASTLATQAAWKALNAAGIKPEQIDVILVATVTGDMPFPSAACLVQKNIGAVRASALDLGAGCTGFIYGLKVAEAMIKSEQAKIILLIGVEILTKITDWTDRNTCVLFGDGAGAVLLRATKEKKGILGTYLAADGRLGDMLMMPGGGSLHPASHESVDKRLHYLKMEGNGVFKVAVEMMGDASLKILEQTKINPNEIDILVPHQANLRIITATAKRLNVPMEKVYVNIDRYGNTSSASIPIGVDEIRNGDKYKPGMKLLLVAFGAGFTWGSAVVTI